MKAGWRTPLFLALALMACRDGRSRAAGRRDASPHVATDTVADATPAAERELWSIEVGMVEPDARARSVFAADIVLLQTARELLAVEPSTGAVRWRASGNHLHPPGLASPLYRVRHGLGPLELIALDPTTGAAGDVVALPAELRTDATLYLVNGGLVALTEQSVRMIDLPAATGQRARLRWTYTGPVNPAIEPVTDGRNLIVGTPTRALALADGKRAWAMEPDCDVFLATHARVLVAAGDDCRQHRAVDVRGHVGTVLPGELRAASTDGVLVEDEAGLHWSADGDAADAVVVRRRPHEEFTAVTIDDGTLLYFSTLDRTVWQRSLAGNDAVALFHASDQVVISPEHDAVRDGGVFVPPAFAGRHVFVYAVGRWRALRRP